MRIIEMLGNNMELTDTIKSYVENKLESVQKIASNLEPCDIQVKVGKTSNHHQKGDVFMSELNVSLPGTNLRASVVMDDLYAAIDESTDDLKRQIKKYKEKLRDAERVVVETYHEEHEEEF